MSDPPPPTPPPTDELGQPRFDGFALAILAVSLLLLLGLVFSDGFDIPEAGDLRLRIAAYIALALLMLGALLLVAGVVLAVADLKRPNKVEAIRTEQDLTASLRGFDAVPGAGTIVKEGVAAVTEVAKGLAGLRPASVAFLMAAAILALSAWLAGVQVDSYTTEVTSTTTTSSTTTSTSTSTTLPK